ncbi:hypothetical protein Xoosp13_228 [Xanthomonas phage Xoo-sp13]|nr:hypothetical protein Xoosp13_228 [Xanthomonas phage Xoo-sp13]
MTGHVKPFFECPHCCKKLTTQVRLDKHKCEAKTRHEYMQTNKGKSAYYCYKAWMNAQGRAVKGQDVFMESKYFNAFVEFCKFCSRVGIPDRKHYIMFMIDKGIMPTQWTSMDIYTDYLHHFDASKTPIEMASITIDTMYDLSNHFECELDEVFEHMESSDIMRLVVARKLSPWILLISKGFISHMRTEASPEQKILIGTVIDHNTWAENFKKDPKSLNTMRKIVSELKI